MKFTKTRTLGRAVLVTILAVTSKHQTFAQEAGRNANLPVYYSKDSITKSDEVFEYDVVAYGGTPAGITATVQAAKEGKSALLISSYDFVGGMTTGGLTATDIGRKSSIGGMAMEYYKKVGKIADFTPTKAEASFLQMLNEAGVKVLRKRFLKEVVLKGNKIHALKLLSGETVKGKIFIDSSYEGDLFAAANVSHHIGREPRDTYGESLAGQWQEVNGKNVYQFCRLPISPYKIEGDPASGLLPEIFEESGKAGQGDYRVQAYNFRMYLSNRKGKIPFPKPRGYNPRQYDLLARFLNHTDKVTWTLNYTTKPMTDGPVQMRNGDSNNAGSFSSDYIGGANKWPDGTFKPDSFSVLPAPKRGTPIPLEKLYEIREELFQDHVSYQLGMMYFLANDKRVPDALKKRVSQFGLDPDEFKTTGNWPHHLYVREGRRMLSTYVMTQANCQLKTTVDDSIGQASYAMDSHFCNRVVVRENGVATVRNEGGFGHACAGPYSISYRSIVPKKSECSNLLVPVCLSSSHVAYGSIRMEPVFMIMGQSAGHAAAIALDDDVAVQDVNYDKLKQKLLASGQKL